MADNDTIMVVEDDDATREFLADNLAADSYGRTSETDRVRGFARGADDYVSKPMA